jgi:hypothetical protein
MENMENDVRIPSEVKDRIIKEAHRRIETEKAQGISNQQVLADIETWLTAQEEVEEARAFRETDLTVRFADGMQIAILLGREQAYGPSMDDGPPLPKGGDKAQTLEESGERSEFHQRGTIASQYGRSNCQKEMTTDGSREKG